MQQSRRIADRSGGLPEADRDARRDGSDAEKWFENGLLRLDIHNADRIVGDVAIIHARTTYTRPDGTEGAGRYTDVWARRGGRWLAVSAHVTRC